MKFFGSIVLFVPSVFFLFYCSQNLEVETIQVPKLDPQPLKSFPFQYNILTGPMEPSSFTLKEVELGAVTGCLGKDCIPQTSYPTLDSTSLRSGSVVSQNQRVLGTMVNGKARAYPLAALWQNEIVNDTLGGVALCINYCPLTGTGLNFQSQLDDSTILTFGVSGLLFNNNLILYDHQTDSYWPQMLFTAGWGPLKGIQPALLPVYEMNWNAWKVLFPNSTVMATSYDRSFPYENYESSPSGLFPQDIDPRLHAKDWVMGVIGSQSSKVYPFKHMGSWKVINDVLDSLPIAIVFDSSADFAHVLVRPSQNGEHLPLFRKDSTGGFPFNLTDENGNFSWDFLGSALDDNHSNLQPVTSAFRGYWLSFGTYYQGIEIWKP